jgi:hypothetical protein
MEAILEPPMAHHVGLDVVGIRLVMEESLFVLHLPSGTSADIAYIVSAV